MRSVLTKVKTKTPELKKKRVVYKVPCRDCEADYIGEMGRSLQKRITKYIYAVKNDDRRPHTLDETHPPAIFIFILRSNLWSDVINHSG